ncbi:exodeoxyribonuclease VII large subunit [Campylobacter ureolyticus]|uniref:Exodeoxyribonuclease 7 large subunit n=1 Tax=Campylobacter ureolyticus TaxID=827 RepID=A0A9Q4KJZ5_9BACT|nr:exodeoxyribonuclease VII large subunit [Campylobacter ureolyticus]MCZ6159347.1 exodeoxyribonuclease VII large subunit [Campylobacter ureolyticus]MCZ6162661.1 exodeoxyribonuclease VII large subunit [Campylobacter ureolyticus]MCZ6164846.1 exodeoxyribonuclease VII large subunit [Campylobacter ureolyticus]MCZ6166644.1 exodeoxyribonuclease VII large subunit [Campylobacter ureolyticus]
MIISVSELNEQAKTLLELNLSNLNVKGEISRITKHSSGHWYFTLKDKDASVSCAMFRFNNQLVKFDPKDGDEVILEASASIYKESGRYQLIIKSMKESGTGDLEKAFLELKEKLLKEGLFSQDHKKPLPKFPSKIAIITSIGSAAYEDIIKTAKVRFDLCKLYFYNSLVQGNLAANDLIKALKKADLVGYDAIVLARGGGSKEDLWCFNDEGLARAIFEAKTPIISAIGHEIDFSISDFVADHRSITPTASMIDLLPDKNELIQKIDNFETNFKKAIKERFLNAKNKVLNLELSFKKIALNSKIEMSFTNLKDIEHKLNFAIQGKISKFESDLAIKKALLEEKNHFFNITKNLIQVQKDGKNISLNDLENGDIITLYSQTTSKKATII